ncbi:MAG TPA: response regulator transcription factor [Solirubrobacteraceae bacterium]|nr:response regulator transcription factor [Solirubrobacteraceae bacterium]
MISRVVSSGGPVLLFELDAPEPDDGGAGRRCEVRLIGRVRNERSPARRQELSAVLLLRAQTPARLLSCVRAVSQGATLPADVLLEQLVLAADDDDAATGTGGEHRERRLTRREFDVLRMLADGDSTREIANAMSYSERTVKNIVRSLLEKLNCRTRAHAVALAARQGVV